MAERPVFVPLKEGKKLVDAVPISFAWHPGMAPSQKQKNVAELHAAAARNGLTALLEVSSKSSSEGGRRMSAFHLPLESGGRKMTVECAFQGSKVFENGGPYVDLYEVDGSQAKRDERLKTSGKLIRFEFEGEMFPLSPPTAFYDWIYIRAMYPHRDWLLRLSQFQGFTDIEFNPEKSVNCQARSCATYIALLWRGTLAEAVDSFARFAEIQSEGSV